MSDRLLMGIIVGVHGVRGLVKVKTFTQNPDALGDYGPLSPEKGGSPLLLHFRHMANDVALYAIDGVTDRDHALALKGTRLFVDRSALSDDVLEEGEFFQADLIGLRVHDAQNQLIGTVKAVEDFGAGPLLDITLAGKKASVFLPFTLACVPVVDVAAGFITITPPDGVLDGDEEQAEKEKPGASANGGEPR